MTFNVLRHRFCFLFWAMLACIWSVNVGFSTIDVCESTQEQDIFKRDASLCVVNKSFVVVNPINDCVATVAYLIVRCLNDLALETRLNNQFITTARQREQAQQQKNKTLGANCCELYWSSMKGAVKGQYLSVHEYEEWSDCQTGEYTFVNQVRCIHLVTGEEVKLGDLFALDTLKSVLDLSNISASTSFFMDDNNLKIQINPTEITTTALVKLDKARRD